MELCPMNPEGAHALKWLLGDDARRAGRIQTGLLVLIVVTLVAISRLALAPRTGEPVYQGRRLSAWLKMYFAEDGDSSQNWKVAQVDLAVRRMGTNSLPILASMVATKNSWLRTKVIRLVEQQQWLKIHIADAEEDKTGAVLAFKALGAVANPAIPSLTQPLNDPTTADVAATCLSYIGPASVPVLSRALTNRDADVRENALRALTDCGGDARVIVPLLLSKLKDTDHWVRASAADGFRVIGIHNPGALDEQPGAVVSSLIKLLDDDDAFVRKTAAESLGSYREQAKPAVPRLLLALKDKDQEVRKRAATSLWLIDEQAATRAGVDIFKSKYGD
jgi:HEAT repeat protein